ncbi:MAG TPA: hypothetical protein DDW50_00045 [Firmicutes bacterium]|jgi:hypothetical protein|nr:hypothetical protein [Bacillota bacterium]
MSNINTVTLSELQQQISICRNRMYRVWKEKGYTDSEVLAVSMELDQLLNRYYLLQPSKAYLRP